MQELENPNLEQRGRTECSIDLVSRNENFNMMLGSKALHLVSENGDISFPVSEVQHDFCEELITNPEQGFLATEFQRRKESLANVKISTVYKSFTELLGSHQIRTNFIRYDKGKSTKYGLLINSEDPSELIRREKAIISDENNHTVKRKHKRLNALDDLADYYSGSNEKVFSRKKVAGMVATGGIVVIGGASYFAYRKIH